MKEYVKENASPGEIAIYKVLSSAALQAYNDGFQTLILPRANSIYETSRTLNLPYYEGETFNETWSTDDGGSDMDLSLTRVLPRLVKDLSEIDTTLFTQDVTLSRAPNLTFEHDKAATDFSEMALHFRDLGFITRKAADLVIDLLDYRQTTPQIINNGDFYPRNLIRTTAGRLVLIDWETWNPHSPFYTIDHPENVAATQYVHMWGNPDWQAAYRSELTEQLGFEPESFAKGVAIKALTLAEFFPKHPQLFHGQIGILNNLSGLLLKDLT